MGDIATGLVPDAAFAAANRLLGMLDCRSDGFRQITTRYVSETLGPKLADVRGSDTSAPPARSRAT